MYVNEKSIDGVSINRLDIIQTGNGDVLHAMKSSEDSCFRFGEAYFSVVYGSAVKAWKRHRAMTLNVVVPVGAIKFVVVDGSEETQIENEFLELVLSRENYARLTIRPGLWFGFQGLAEGENLLLNLADIEHDPMEADTAPVDAFNYEWK